MYHQMKECQTEPLSQPNTTKETTHLTYYSQQQDLGDRKNTACYTCGQKGHWYRDCPLKSFKDDSQHIWCRCGHGRCELKISMSEKNPGRRYYTCPVKRGAKCNNGFVKWCDDVVESDWQPPQFKYPECQCPAGVCKREKAIHNGVVKCYFTCPVKPGQGYCGYKVWEDELPYNLQTLSCKRVLNGFGEGDQNGQDDNYLDEGDKLLLNLSKKMKVMDNSEDPTLIAVSEAELSLSEDEALECDAIEKKASQLSCLTESTPSRINGRQNVFARHIFAGADPSLGVFPSFNPIDVPKQASITDVPSAEKNQLDATGLSQLTQVSSSCCCTEFPKDGVIPNKKLMSRAQRQRQMAFAAQQQLLIDLAMLEPHDHESMKEAAEDTFAVLDNLGANHHTLFSEHVWDFINLTSSVAQVTKSIECLEEDRKRIEEESAKLGDVKNLYAKTEAQFQASEQRRQLLCKEISHLEAILVEKQNMLKSYESETSNIGIELGVLRRTMLEADATLKARTEQAEVAEVARKLGEDREAKQIAAKAALEKALLELEC